MADEKSLYIDTHKPIKLSTWKHSFTATMLPQGDNKRNN